MENSSNNKVSAVYVVTDGQDAVQIWSTANPQMKLGNLKDISKKPLRVVYALPTTMDSMEIEAAAHRTLEKFQDGNWFFVSETKAIEAIEAAAESLRKRSAAPLRATLYFRRAIGILLALPVAILCPPLLAPISEMLG